MTISKKLLIAGALLVGMQQIAQAYDAAALKTEVVQLKNAMQELKKRPGQEAKKATKYVKTMITDNNFLRSDKDIIVLAKIVNSDATSDSKIASILNIQTEKNFLASAVLGTTTVCTVVAMHFFGSLKN